MYPKRLTRNSSNTFFIHWEWKHDLGVSSAFHVDFNVHDYAYAVLKESKKGLLSTIKEANDNHFDLRSGNQLVSRPLHPCGTSATETGDGARGDIEHTCGLSRCGASVRPWPAYK